MIMKTAGSQGHNLAVTALYVPHLLKRGKGFVHLARPDPGGNGEIEGGRHDAQRPLGLSLFLDKALKNVLWRSLWEGLKYLVWPDPGKHGEVEGGCRDAQGPQAAVERIRHE